MKRERRVKLISAVIIIVVFILSLCKFKRESKIQIVGSRPSVKAQLDGTSGLTMNYHVGNAVGFASNINNALSCFLLAHLTNSTFRMVAYRKWDYGPLTDFLASPFIVEGTTDSILSLTTTKFPAPDLDTFKTFAGNLKKKVTLQIRPFENDFWEPFRQLTSDLETHTVGGYRAVFELKRDLVNDNFWILQPLYAQFISFIMENHPLLGSKEYEFVAVHARRGDKISWGEMQDLYPMSSYAKEVLRIAERTQRKVVAFFFSDDAKSFELFQGQVAANASFVEAVLTLQSLYQFVHEKWGRGLYYNGYLPQPIDLLDIIADARDHDQEDFGSRPEAERLKNARDLFLSICLARHSNYFVGTFSSNIGRLIALVRHNGDLETNISLDERWTST
jgi:hypothetical protein